MRRDSWRSVPTMCRPPARTTSSCSFAHSTLSRSQVTSELLSSVSSRRAWKAAVLLAFAWRASGSGPTSCRAIISGLPPSTMSVPRPAMLVEMVTEPLRPAWATISASRWWCLAFRTLCGMPRFLRSAETRLALRHRDRAHQDRLALLVQALDLVDDGVELLALGLVDDVLVSPCGSSAWLVGMTTTSRL